MVGLLNARVYLLSTLDCLLMPKKRNSRQKRQEKSRERAAQYYLSRENNHRVVHREFDEPAVTEREQIVVRVEFQPEAEPAIEDGEEASNNDSESLADFNEGLSDISSGDFELEEPVATTEDPVDVPQSSSHRETVPSRENISFSTAPDVSDNAQQFEDVDVLDLGGQAEIYDYEP